MAPTSRYEIPRNIKSDFFIRGCRKVDGVPPVDAQKLIKFVVLEKVAKQKAARFINQPHQFVKRISLDPRSQPKGIANGDPTPTRRP
jgi:hypothetical protein